MFSIEPHQFDSEFEELERKSRDFDDWLDTFLDDLRFMVQQEYFWFEHERDRHSWKTRREFEMLRQQPEDRLIASDPDTLNLQEKNHQRILKQRRANAREPTQDEWTPVIDKLLQTCERFEDYMDHKLLNGDVSARDYDRIIGARFSFPKPVEDILPQSNNWQDRYWLDGQGELKAHNLRDRLRRATRRAITTSPSWRPEIDQLIGEEARLPMDTPPSKSVMDNDVERNRALHGIRIAGNPEIWGRLMFEIQEEHAAIEQFLKEVNCPKQDVKAICDAYEQAIYNHFDYYPTHEYVAELYPVAKQGLHAMKQKLMELHPEWESEMNTYVAHCREGKPR